MCSTQHYSCHTPKQRSTAPTSPDLHRTLTMMKNDMKLKRSLIIGNEAEDISISSSGKAMTSQKHRGNLPHVSRTAEKRLSESTATVTASIPNPEHMALEIPIIVVTDPEGQHWQPTIYQMEPKKVFYLAPGLYPELASPTAEERDIIATTPYVPTPVSVSLLRSVRRKISAAFRIRSNNTASTPHSEQPQITFSLH
jgi:hypothetical protein